MNNPGYNSGNQMYQGRNPILSSNPAVNTLKTIGSSGKFLAAAILVTLHALLLVCATFMISSQFDNIIKDINSYLVDNDGNYYQYYEAFYNLIFAIFSTSLFIIMIFTFAISVLFAIGIWFTYTTCKSTNSGGISTSGLTICKVICIIFAYLYGLVTAVLTVAVFAMIFADESSLYGESILFLLYIILFLSCSVVPMLYYIFLVKTINRIKATAETGVPDSRISTFVIVLNWIVGILNALIGLLFLFFFPLNGLDYLVNSAAFILFAIILSSYKAQMSALMSGMSGYNVTSYAQPQANPAGVYIPSAQADRTESDDKGDGSDIQ